eukprot:scaffold2434_cov116-Isochrysis_galbana.AAC.3
MRRGGSGACRPPVPALVHACALRVVSSVSSFVAGLAAARAGAEAGAARASRLPAPRAKSPETNALAARGLAPDPGPWVPGCIRACAMRVRVYLRAAFIHVCASWPGVRAGSS